MKKDTQKPAIRGWMEMLFRSESAPKVKSLDDVQPGYYTAFGGKLATPEFPFIYDVYEMFGHETGSDVPDSLPRRLREGDAINLILKHPHILQVVTLVLITKGTLLSVLKTDKSVRADRLRLRRSEVDMDDNYKMTVTPILGESFESFLVNK